MKIDNKVILATLIVLLAVQATQGQFLFNLISGVFGMFGSIFSLAFQFTSNCLSSASTAVMAVPSSVFVVMANIHPTIFKLLFNVNATVNAVENTTNAFNATVNNFSLSVSPSSNLIGRLVTGVAKDSILGAGFSLSSIMAISAGRRYSRPSGGSLDDDDYNPTDSLCIPDSSSNSSSTNATIGCQASVFVYMVNMHIKNLKTIGKWYEKVNSFVNSSCATPNTTSIQNLTDLWGNLSAAANVYTNLTVVNGTFLAFVNSTLGANLTDAINQTQALFDSINNATACIINATCNDARLRINSFGMFAEFGELPKMLAKFWRRNSRRISTNGLNSFVTNTQSLNTQLNTTVQNIGTLQSRYNDRNTYLIATFSNSIANLFGAMNAFLNNIFSQSYLVNVTMNNVINSTECNKSAIILNATSVANATASNLTSVIASENITSCLGHIDLIVDALSILTINFTGCGKIADDQHDAAIADIANVPANVTVTYNSTLSALSTCYVWHCSNTSNTFSSIGMDCVKDPSFYTATTYFDWSRFAIVTSYAPSARANNWSSCVSNVVAMANANINSTGNVTLSAVANLQNSTCNATSNLATCTDSIVAKFITIVFTQLSANYEACKAASTTTVAPTSTTVAPTTTIPAAPTTTTAAPTTTIPAAPTTTTVAPTTT